MQPPLNHAALVTGPALPPDGPSGRASCNATRCAALTGTCKGGDACPRAEGTGCTNELPPDADGGPEHNTPPPPPHGTGKGKRKEFPCNAQRQALLSSRGGQGCIGRSGGTPPPPPGRPAYAQPLSPCHQVPASMAFVTDSYRPQPLWQRPPTACPMASGAASAVLPF